MPVLPETSSNEYKGVMAAFIKKPSLPVQRNNNKNML